MKLGASAISSAAFLRLPEPALRGVDTYEKLREFGLEDYKGIYERGAEIASLFGESTFLWAPITKILSGIVSHGFDRHEDVMVKNMRDGWGTQFDKRHDVTLVKLQHLNIKIDKSAQSTSRAEAKSFLVQAAKKFPGIALAMPPDITILDSGGSYSGDTISLTTPHSIKSAPVTYLHEGTHGADYSWHAIRQYFLKDRFISYVDHYLSSVYYVARYLWLRSPNVMAFLEEAPLLKIMGGTENSYINRDLLSQMIQIRTNIGLASNIDLANDLSDRKVTKEWNGLVWLTGTFLDAFQNSDRQVFIEKNREDFKKLFISGIASGGAHLPGLLVDIEHFLTGPAQKTGGGLPASESEYDNCPLLVINTDLQKSRMLLYGSFKDVPSLAEIKDAFYPTQ